ncbi:MAG TPA: hypothetical protein P5270_08315, partial [Victivallales bacterium]|nr:hypothetical protein [Victivallales bacterium]
VILPIFFYFFRVEEDSLCGEIDFRFGGVLSLVLCVSLYIYSFVFPIKQQYEKARVFAKNIVELVPAKSDFYIGRGLSAEAFLFYMDRDYKITEELSPKAVEGGFLLIEEDRIEVIPENAKKIKYGKLALLLIPPEK